MDKIKLAITTKDISILEKLSDDEDEWVRAAVAKNPNIQPELKTKILLPD